MSQPNSAQQATKWSQFGTLITVFFFWGFVAASNDILIPVFKKLSASIMPKVKWFLLHFMLLTLLDPLFILLYPS